MQERAPQSGTGASAATPSAPELPYVFIKAVGEVDKQSSCSLGLLIVIFQSTNNIFFS